MTYNIRKRTKVLINTDPQRRCYNGCHYSSELVWRPWEDIAFGIEEPDIQDKLHFWRDLNDYAVSQRGDSAYCEFEAYKHG